MLGRRVLIWVRFTLDNAGCVHNRVREVRCEFTSWNRGHALNQLGLRSICADYSPYCWRRLVLALIIAD